MNNLMNTPFQKNSVISCASNSRMKWEHCKNSTCPFKVDPFDVEVLVVKSTTQSYCCSQLAEDVGKELEFFEVYRMWTNTI
jgi:hypothetical protein